MVEQAVLTGFGEPCVVILCQVAAHFCLVTVIFEKKEMVEQAALTGFCEPCVVILCQVAAHFSCS